MKIAAWCAYQKDASGLKRVETYLRVILYTVIKFEISSLLNTATNVVRDDLLQAIQIINALMQRGRIQH